MKNIVKTAVISVGLVSVLGLTACQNTPQDTRAQGHKMPKSEKMKDARPHFAKQDRHQGMRGEFRGHEGRKKPLTAEQKAQIEKMFAERKANMQALQQACEGKAGQNISVKIGDKTMTGTCQVNFRPDRPQAKTPVPAATSTQS